MAEKHKSIILGITGASGTVYGLRLLEYLLSQGTARKRTNSRLRRTNDRSVISSDAESATSVSHASKRKYKLRLLLVK